MDVVFVSDPRLVRQVLALDGKHPINIVFDSPGHIRKHELKDRYSFHIINLILYLFYFYFYFYLYLFIYYIFYFDFFAYVLKEVLVNLKKT